MAMMTREPGFLGMAKRKAQKQGMLTIPKRWTPQGGGEEEYPAFVNQKEMALLKQQGGQGFMTPYGIPSFELSDEFEASTLDSSETVQQQVTDYKRNDNSKGQPGGTVPVKPTTKPKVTYDFSYDTSLSPLDNIKRIDIVGWLKSLGDGKPKGVTPDNAVKYLTDNPDAAQGAYEQQGGPEAVTASNSEEAAKTAAYAKDRKEDYDEKKRLKDSRQSSVDEYGDYKTEVKNLGIDSKELTEGTMQDDEGRGPDHPDYVEAEGKMRGGFAGDVGKLDKYEDQFGDIAADAKTRGDTAQGQYGGVMTDEQGNKVGDANYDASTASIKGGAAGMGATALENLGKGVMTDASGKTADDPDYDASSATMQGGYKQVTGQGVVDAAAKGTTGFDTGAGEVDIARKQFGKEGFQKDIKGMSEKALSGEVGQREAGMLKGQMEQQRMASQKGSEEKLRRELAQSGASPSEIAQKVAQFQQQSAAQQQQAGRTEALSSQLQGQQMGQSSLEQAAKLKGQEAGLANTSATLAEQKAALTGKGAAMAMDAAGTEDKTKLASLEGQASTAEAGAGMRMEGIKGGAELGFKGSEIQGDMLGAGVDSVTASGVAKDRVAGGIDQQADMVGDQAEFTQAELDDTIAQETQAYTKEESRLTREAQGTPDDPYYRPPEETVEADTGDLPPGTTVALEPPDELDPPIEEKAEGGPVQGGKPYIVGEKGRELFVPNQSGNITPNHQMPKGGIEIKQSGKHNFTVAPKEQSAPASKGGINAPPPQPQLQGAPPQGQGGAEAQRQAFDRRNEELQRGTPAQPVQGGLSPLQQGGMMGAQQLNQPPQGNQQQAMMQNKAEEAKQMGQGGYDMTVNAMKHPGGIGGMMGQGQAGIPQQGGLMGQNQNMSPEQQQVMEAQNKKRRQMEMQSFQMR